MDARPCRPRAGHLAQKKTLSASERDEWARAAFRVPIADKAAADFVVVDETGLKLDLTSRYSRAPQGQPAIEKVPRNTPVNTTLIGSCSLAGMGPSMLVSGGVDAATFLVYLEHLLQVYGERPITLIVDNYSSHTAAEVKTWLSSHPQLQIHYLPKYCSHLNPVERIWLRLKGQVAASRLYGSLKELLITVACFFDAMTPAQALIWAAEEK